MVDQVGSASDDKVPSGKRWQDVNREVERSPKAEANSEHRRESSLQGTQGLWAASGQNGSGLERRHMARHKAQKQ